jgi:hypothetical protein
LPNKEKIKEKVQDLRVRKDLRVLKENSVGNVVGLATLRMLALQEE